MAALSFVLQVAGLILLWIHDPWLALGAFLLVWGYGITQRRGS